MNTDSIHIVIDGNFILHQIHDSYLNNLNLYHDSNSKSEERKKNKNFKIYSKLINLIPNEFLIEIKNLLNTIRTLDYSYNQSNFESVWILWDFGVSNYRTSLDSHYKCRNRSTKRYINFYDIRTKIIELLNNSDMISLGINGVEADDIAYRISRYYPKGLLISGDKNWNNFIYNQDWSYLNLWSFEIDESYVNYKEQIIKNAILKVFSDKNYSPYNSFNEVDFLIENYLPKYEEDFKKLFNISNDDEEWMYLNSDQENFFSKYILEKEGVKFDDRVIKNLSDYTYDFIHNLYVIGQSLSIRSEIDEKVRLLDNSLVPINLDLNQYYKKFTANIPIPN